jgi:tRNA A37 threonylcarbamoyltransferase TsaD
LPLTEQALIQTQTQLSDLTAIAFSRGPSLYPKPPQTLGGYHSYIHQ